MYEYYYTQCTYCICIAMYAGFHLEHSSRTYMVIVVCILANKFQGWEQKSTTCAIYKYVCFV